MVQAAGKSVGRRLLGGRHREGKGSSSCVMVGVSRCLVIVLDVEYRRYAMG
jgi:hypothetical protein